MENETINSLLQVTCPHCQRQICVGVGQLHAQLLFTMTKEQLGAKKKELLRVIDESSLEEDKKKQMREMYGDERFFIDPTVADLMIQEIRTHFANTNQKGNETEETQVK